MWGTIPDWINVAIAFLALLLFVIVEKEKIVLKKNLSNNQSSTIIESGVKIRAELYSRIFIGTIIGLSLTPIYSWVFSELSQDEIINFEIEGTAIVISAIILSTITSFIYFKFYATWASIFVHWIERLVISYFFFFYIFLSIFPTKNIETSKYYLHYDTFFNVPSCIFMFLLIGFPSTPMDWIIRIARHSSKNTG